LSGVAASSVYLHELDQAPQECAGGEGGGRLATFDNQTVLSVTLLTRPPRSCSHGKCESSGNCRVGTAEQGESGAGLAAPRMSICTEVERRGWDLIEVFEDVGASGRAILGRPGLIGALDAIEAGSAQGLVVAKLDRLSRSLLDFAALMARSRENGWMLCCLDLCVDTSTRRAR
jgi:Resolvase, N terminal domain